MPNKYDASKDRGRGPSPGKSQGINIDAKALNDPNLRPDRYIAGLLSDASEKDIDEYQQALQKMKNRTSTDLQQNVYQNRTQFIKISKEAEKLKGEMRALRNLMSELKTNTTALRTTSSQGSSASNDFDSGFPSTLSKRDKRSSVADRTAMWNSQLQVRFLIAFRSVYYVYLSIKGSMEDCRGLTEVSARPSRPSRGSECWALD